VERGMAADERWPVHLNPCGRQRAENPGRWRWDRCSPARAEGEVEEQHRRGDEQG